MENRHGLAVDVCVVHATGTAEREAATGLVGRAAGAPRTVGGDKGYDTADFIDACAASATPHIAQKITYSALDARTIRHRATRLANVCVNGLKRSSTGSRRSVDCGNFAIAAAHA